MEGCPKTNALGALRRRRKHGQRVGRNRELLEEVVINDRVHVKSTFVGVLDLAHDLPGHVVIRLAGGRLHFAINAESHAGSC